MTLYDEIKKELNSQIFSGKTQEEIARETGLSQSHVCHLKNGSREIGKIKLENFLKLFPGAQINLHGDTINGTATASGNGVAVGNDFSGGAKCKERIEAISNAILDSDMDDAAKIKALKIIKETK